MEKDFKMWKHTVSVLVIVTVTNYARANISPEIANKIQCCECKSMVPPEMRDIEPQLGPSPFEIKIAKNLTAYHLTPDINGKILIHYTNTGHQW